MRLIVPWDQFRVGFVATLGLCPLPALRPAITTGRTGPMRLPPAGRAAT